MSKTHSPPCLSFDDCDIDDHLVDTPTANKVTTSYQLTNKFVASKGKPKRSLAYMKGIKSADYANESNAEPNSPLICQPDLIPNGKHMTQITLYCLLLDMFIS